MTDEATILELGARYCHMLRAVERAHALDDHVEVRRLLNSIDPVDVEYLGDYLLGAALHSDFKARGSRTVLVIDGNGPSQDVPDESPDPYDWASAPAEIVPESLDAWRTPCS